MLFPSFALGFPVDQHSQDWAGAALLPKEHLGKGHSQKKLSWCFPIFHGSLPNPFLAIPIPVEQQDTQGSLLCPNPWMQGIALGSFSMGWNSSQSCSGFPGSMRDPAGINPKSRLRGMIPVDKSPNPTSQRPGIAGRAGNGSGDCSVPLIFCFVSHSKPPCGEGKGVSETKIPGILPLPASSCWDPAGSKLGGNPSIPRVAVPAASQGIQTEFGKPGSAPVGIGMPGIVEPGVGMATWDLSQNSQPCHSQV